MQYSLKKRTNFSKKREKLEKFINSAPFLAKWFVMLAQGDIMKRILLLSFVLLIFTALLLSACARTPESEFLKGIDTSNIPENPNTGIYAVENYVSADFDLVSSFSMTDYEQESLAYGLTALRDIPFSDKDSSFTTFDVYYKEELLESSQTLPLVFLVHGGNENGPGKKNLEVMAQIYAEQTDVVAVAMNYRYDPAKISTGFSPYHDLACSMATTKGIAHHFNADPNTVVMHGFSFGSHVSSRMLFDDKTNWLEHCPEQDPNFREVEGFIIHSGNGLGVLLEPGQEVEFAEDEVRITGPNTLLNELKTKYEDPAPRDGAINYIGAEDAANIPQVQFIYGGADPKFRMEEMEEFRGFVEDAGIPTQLYIEPLAQHGPQGHETIGIKEVIWDFKEEVTG